jgi:hypothetical protein
MPNQYRERLYEIAEFVHFLYFIVAMLAVVLRL